MGAVINGKSSPFLKFFRENTASLAVYWAYCAHMNTEGIAWRGLRSLVTETGYSLNSVKEAREWLIKHELLERVEEYTPKKWRKLESEAQQQAKMRYYNEYYRVCPVLVIDGVEYPMLYTPLDDAEEDNEEGVSPGETGGVAQNDTQNLIPNVLDKSSTAKSAVPTTPADNVPVATKKQSKPNPWYDAIHAVWGYNGEMNGAMFKMLQGKATAAAWKIGNLPPENAITSPDDLLRWAAWYRATELDNNPKLNMLEERMKIQSSIIGWQLLGCPDVETQVAQTTVSDFPIPPDVFDVWMHTNGSGELSEAKFAARRAGLVWDDAAETAWLRAYKAERGMK